MKRILTIVLAALLCLSVVPAAYAENAGVTEPRQAAEALYDLGLFRGVGYEADGEPNFALGTAPNRAEAVTMLVRLLGRESEALAGNWTTPFTDVPKWAVPYVGYAYENGLTKGVSETAFGSAAAVTDSQYLTFVLRALGYSSETDFKWDAAWELSDKLGFTAGEYPKDSAFLRGDLAVISYNALSAAYKGSSRTLLESLAEAGAVDLNDENKLQFYRVLTDVSARHRTTVTTPVDDSALSRYTVSDSTANLLTDSEISALLANSTHQSTVSRAEAESDVDLLFRALRSAYCAYYYFGADKFETAQRNVTQWLNQFTMVKVTDLEDKIADEMSFARDAHAVFCTRASEADVRYEYFYVDGLRLYAEDGSYYKVEGGERWYLRECSDSRVSIRLTLMEDGELVYAPVLFVPLTEVKNCTLTYQNASGKTKTETAAWTQSRAYSGTLLRPDVKSFRENGIQYISVRSFMGDYDADLQDFVASGKDARDAKAIVFDLRANHGGNDQYAGNWVRNFTGTAPKYSVAVGNRYSKLRAAAMGEGSGLAGSFQQFKQTGVFQNNDIPIIVLVDDGCASSGESMLNFLKTLDNTIVIGTNSGGYQLCGNDISMTLPNTGMYLYFGVSLTFPYVMENVDYKGYEPDVWCSADTSLDAVLNMMVRYQLTDRATADTIAAKAAVKDVAMEFGGVKVSPGQTFSSGAGEHMLYPTLDGKRVTDYTYTVGGSAILSHSRTADGGIKVKVIGSGTETITVTIGGADYRFYWHSDAKVNVGDAPDGDLTLIFKGNVVKPGEQFGAWKWVYFLDVMVNGQRVTDFTYTVDRDGILYHRKTADGKIAVSVIGNGITPLTVHYNGKDYSFIWVTEGFDGDVCVPDDPENVTLRWGEHDIYPGEAFGTWEGSYKLWPMLDGKTITDYTVRNENPEVATVQKAADGSVELTVVADGSARLTFTVNGKDYTFYWYAASPD